MNFDLSEKHQMLRESVREFRENEMEPLLEGIDPDATHIPKKDEETLQEKAKKQGLWAMGIPEEYGGRGIGILGRVISLEELSKHRLGLYNPGLGGVKLTPGIRVGSPEVYLDTASDFLMDRFIEPTLRGELQSCFALTEPAAGSDPTSMETRAVKDGDEWVINGQKHYIGDAGWCDYGILFSKTTVDGSDEGITCFLIDSDNDGWEMERQMDVIRPFDPFKVSITDLRIDDAFRLTEVGDGFDLAASGVRSGRVTYSAQHIGVATEAMEMALEYSRERETFGKEISKRQAIQWMIADSAVDIHSARLALYDCAWKADRDIDMRHEISMVKLQSSEVLGDVLDKAIQIHGGKGVDKELPLERWYREARIRRIGEGTSEIQRRTVARNLIKDYEPVDLLDKVNE